MTPPKLLLCVLIYLKTLLCFAEAPASKMVANNFNELLFGQGVQGEGTLIFGDETETETIILGTETGIYGTGLVIKGDWLPSPYKKKFSSQTIIQVSLGTLKSKLEGKVPQFAMATFISSGPLLETTAYLFEKNSKTNQLPSHWAMLNFTSPKSQLTQNEQEKLQSTFFGSLGGVTLTPLGESNQVILKTNSSKLVFKKQKMKFEFQTTLATPFNGLEKTLTGSIVFPVFTPSSKSAEALAQKIGKSLNWTDSESPQKPQTQRKLTGAPEKSR